MKAIKNFSAICLLAFATILITSCSKSDTSGSLLGPSGHAVTIQAMQFQPATLTVVAGDQITWTNTDTQAHTVTSNDGTSFNSGNIAPQGTFTVTLNVNGSYPYHCSLHPTMTGTIQVVTR